MRYLNFYVSHSQNLQIPKSKYGKLKNKYISKYHLNISYNLPQAAVEQEEFQIWA